MKKSIILIASALFFLSSCDKPSLENNPEPGSMIEFSLYGETKTYTSVNAGVNTLTGGKYYSFVGTKNPVAENIFSLTVFTDSLRPGTYTLNSGIVNYREGSKVVTNMNPTNFTLTVESNNAGLVNGTFSGTLYDHTTNSNCTVVQGKIQNIQISY